MKAQTTGSAPARQGIPLRAPPGAGRDHPADPASVAHLRRQVRTLSSAVAGLRTALRELALRDAERRTVSSLLERYGAIYEESRQVLDKVDTLNWTSTRRSHR